ncbi:MAG: type III restriction-modification system endonuclease [Pleomorphochaeta sp.]
MKFNFKIQKYQTDAVNSVVNVFEGQSYHDGISYIRDIGKTENKQKEINFNRYYSGKEEIIDELGFKNKKIELSDDSLLQNIKRIQSLNNIKTSKNLVKNLGRCSLDIEMETGTGKTYVYIKTMFELNKKYGWSKFIVVVPSIAIREGVKKSFEMTEDHFMEYYGKKARFFIYDSSNLRQLDNFSSDSGINVMIINTQAFASSFDNKKRNNQTRKIYSEIEDFESRRPIDIIKANRPILILDEPQKMGGEKTQNALKNNFNPLFSLNYSATHKKQHNLIYVLDALDAYNKKLVKKIEVKGFEIQNLKGIEAYICLEQIIISPDKSPKARMEFEIKFGNAIKRKTRILDVKDSLYVISNEMEQYKGYVISEIDPNNALASFTNGKQIKVGEITGNSSDKDIRRIQIRETLLSHFEKEEDLFNKGIKSLTLFFIDEVAKYRQYNENGEELLGEYGKIFEEEYLNILDSKIGLFETPYQKYLKEKCSNVSKVHEGYFSIDKKTKRIIDSAEKGKEGLSDDISAYDHILKKKELLLSFEDPVRFIFSHSALREGWDNPNIFQICTLKHSNSKTTKRQEVGRGLRICVNKDGNRMDSQRCGDQVHITNLLTVIASDSYKNFVSDLQKNIEKDLFDRPTAATKEYFKGKYISIDGQSMLIDDEKANLIEYYLISNGYVDTKRQITDKYHSDIEMNSVAHLPKELVKMEEGIHQLIQSVYDENVLKNMFTDGHQTKIIENPLNANFHKKEFQELWKQINHKYAYVVQFDSEELIRKAIDTINRELYITELKYTTTVGRQKDDITDFAISNGSSFCSEQTRTETLRNAVKSNIKYDLVGKISEATLLTRKTVVNILKNINKEKLDMFKLNPEEFITKINKIIKEQKSTMIVEHISYNKIDGEYKSDIFTKEKNTKSFDKAYKAKKSIQDYVFTDGLAEMSVERRFAEDLDSASEVCVYAKLPKGFYIPTPVGNYSPDWAIAFYEGTVKHVFFVAETKGSLDSMNLRPIEQAKISCAKKLFNEMSTSKVKYHDVDSYQSLLDIMHSL